MDGFDQLPESLVTEILNRVRDVKTLVGCRSLSRRFRSIVPLVDSLKLRVDRVDSPESDSDSNCLSFVRSVARSLHGLLHHSSRTVDLDRIRFPNSPARILSRFDRIRRLEMELPGGDVRIEKGAVVKWKAEYGATLRSCVIVAFRSVTESVTVLENCNCGCGEGEAEFARGLKPRVVWTISALVAASARHFFLRDVVKENDSMEELVLGDRDGEGTLVMDAEGLKEYREDRAAQGHEELKLVADALAERLQRTTVPSVRMSMRHAPRLRLRSGVCLDGATVVVVRPISEVRVDAEDAEMAMAAFGGGDDIYGEAVRSLVKSRRYLLEMNSF